MEIVEEVQDFNIKTKVEEEVQVVKEKKYFCDCGKGYITRSGLRKHKKKCNEKDNNDNIMDDFDTNNEIVNNDVEEEDEREKQVLKQQLTALYLHNPSIKLDKPINTEYLELIDNMSVKELRMRLMEIKQNLTTKLDRRFSDTFISIGSVLVGSVLGISEELEVVNLNDQLLCESAQETLSFKLGLFALPAEIKTSGLFLVNTLSVYTEKMKREQKLKNEKRKLLLLQQEEQRKLKEISKKPEENKINIPSPVDDEKTNDPDKNDGSIFDST